MATTEPSPTKVTQVQTLSRGLRVLELLAEAARPLRIDEIATELGVHRSIAYRIVRTLEAHRVVTRDETGRCLPGAGLAVLARAVSGNLQAKALPELAGLADSLGMTSFVVVHDHDECITLASVEPRYGSASVAQHPGTRHPLDVGAPGIALLTELWAQGIGTASGSDQVRARVETASRQGYATSHSEVFAGLSSVAVPLALTRGPVAAFAVVYAGTEMSVPDIARRLQDAARSIRSQIG